jgi:hypothetical protein
MPYYTLRRKTPMKRGVWKKKPYVWARNPKPKKPMVQKSAKQKGRDAQWRKVQKQWLELEPFCRVCAMFGDEVKATEVHHKRGRNGALLCDTRFLASTCRAHRMWPHDNPVQARAVGLLAPANEWGVVPRE